MLFLFWLLLSSVILFYNWWRRRVAIISAVILIVDIIYYEGIIYVAYGSWWDSIYRRIIKYYNNLTINKRKNIFKIVGATICLLVIIKLIVFPFLSDILSNAGNAILDSSKERYFNWDITIQEQEKPKEKATIYCKIWKAIWKSAKNMRCLWRTNDYVSEQKDLFIEALYLNPTNEEEIKIKSNLMRLYYGNDNNIASQYANEVLNSNWYWMKYYDTIISDAYIVLWYIASDEYRENDAIDMFNNAWSLAEDDMQKFSVLMAKALAYTYWWKYGAAFSIVESIKNSNYKIPNESKNELDALEKKIKIELNSSKTDNF